MMTMTREELASTPLGKTYDCLRALLLIRRGERSVTFSALGAWWRIEIHFVNGQLRFEIRNLSH